MCARVGVRARVDAGVLGAFFSTKIVEKAVFRVFRVIGACGCVCVGVYARGGVWGCVRARECVRARGCGCPCAGFFRFLRDPHPHPRGERVRTPTPREPGPPSATCVWVTLVATTSARSQQGYHTRAHIHVCNTRVDRQRDAERYVRPRRHRRAIFDAGFHSTACSQLRHARAGGRA